MSALFPIHTGEAGGIVGRLLSIVIGLWLITMIVAVVLLWAKRRKPRARPRVSLASATVDKVGLRRGIEYADGPHSSRHDDA